jgi:hypothetical protein
MYPDRSYSSSGMFWSMGDLGEDISVDLGPLTSFWDFDDGWDIQFSIRVFLYIGRQSPQIALPSFWIFPILGRQLITLWVQRADRRLLILLLLTNAIDTTTDMWVIDYGHSGGYFQGLATNSVIYLPSSTIFMAIWLGKCDYLRVAGLNDGKRQMQSAVRKSNSRHRWVPHMRQPVQGENALCE